MSKRPLFDPKDDEYITFDRLGGNPEVKEGKINIKDIVGEVYGGMPDEELPIPEKKVKRKRKKTGGRE